MQVLPACLKPVIVDVHIECVQVLCFRRSRTRIRSNEAPQQKSGRVVNRSPYVKEQFESTTLPYFHATITARPSTHEEFLKLGFLRTIPTSISPFSAKT